MKLTSLPGCRDIFLDTLREWGLNVEYLVEQGYDGALVMRSPINGVQAKIAAEYPNATYLHCRSHVLSLGLSSSCKNVKVIRNLFDNVGRITWFLGGSAKRMQILLKTTRVDEDDGLMKLLKVFEENVIYKASSDSFDAVKRGLNTNTVPKFCATRWTTRVTTLSALLAKYCSVIQALERRADCSRGDPQIEAHALVRLLNDSQFIIALVVAQAVLSFFACVTKTLQSKDCNLGEAYKDIHISKACVQDNRTDEFWNTLWVTLRQNHVLPTYRDIVLMQGATLTRL